MSAPTDKSARPLTSSTGLPNSILFYCKDCHEMTDVKRVGRQYVYTCVKCGTKNVAFGTKRSIISFFHIEEGEGEETTK
ncbi:MAG: hypothetical protein UT36_C0001G0104 [Candidatus Peregrinibacteria bacterium GW2011_GWF2_39_17]|nr:MAG: hypothetical protein UT36_C0001G0104 [Candidatus Peregrinibacteria bacterium GW2011_GWF2_39_17]HCW32445.1 hypothetical protein [Candidatus Peregrinibacteria bacterium]